MNFVVSCTGFSLFKTIKANPFKSLMSSNFVPLMVLTISCEFTPFTLAYLLGDLLIRREGIIMESC